ncbi:Phosphoribosylanthranilate isomerase [Pseudomonas syringae pv. actinidiae]|uniref:Phosphoribosylanthranilate isomerase n=1 Tax=Pseudomonas syringae pv. actinidiae TaxID=103796 RepID=M1ILU8_PSESF|nr:hypothetical protein [Pseudomonas syringae pv. actinidiae]AGE82495.1 hypothetical protein [Pseudomonas syringae pv. actinidiae]GBH20315.1 Phosphoribosylanthranilate isomerase [Pseudomonas syringae pv. actinidiae]
MIGVPGVPRLAMGMSQSLHPVSNLSDSTAIELHGLKIG